MSTQTTLKMTTGDKVVVWIFCGALGLALGLALPWLLGHIANWPLPFIDYLKFLGSFDNPLMVFGRPAVLGVVGLVVAFVITYESPELTISEHKIQVKEGDDLRTIERDQIAGVYRRNGKVRIESHAGRVLFEGDVSVKRAVIATTFLRFGYPWEGTESTTDSTDNTDSTSKADNEHNN